MPLQHDHNPVNSPAVSPKIGFNAIFLAREIPRILRQGDIDRDFLPVYCYGGDYLPHWGPFALKATLLNALNLPLLMLANMKIFYNPN